MKTEERIKEIFAQALQQPSRADRQRFLAEACKGELELRAQVESLLRAHEEAGDFLGQTIQLPESDFVIERVGTMIGRYRVLQKIGEGGFGVVYMAEQVEPVQRKVALKIIKAGMDTREVVARFEAERQALALMDHPNIAHVLDAGATEAGRPYFVMELVNGIPLTDFCDQQKLSTDERLQLFMKVCHAVQHAHQKGIIHRDLKPSNVLVTLHDAEPVPKVIDFGVAKALGQKLTEKTVFTGFRDMIGTPAYMSPEQAELSGLDIDTRSDIYSLGVLLYELLTGVTPFDADTLRKVALDEIRRIIRETEPPKPSTRLRTLGDQLIEVAARRHTEAATLQRLLRRDLDWIVMKALEKDRRRRYETANALARDLEHHRHNEPVLAAPPSAAYRFGRFAKRHRAALVTSITFVALIATGTVISVWEAVYASRMASRELQQRQRAESLAQTLRENLYATQINLAQQYFEQSDADRTKALLDSLRPAPGETDLRGFEWYYLWRICHSEQLKLIGHVGGVRSVSVSPDGLTVASAGEEGLIRLWNAADGGQRVPLAGHAGWVSTVAFSPDGKMLASGGADGTVRLWDPIAGRQSFVLGNVAGEVMRVAFSRQGDRLAAASGTIPPCGGNPSDKYFCETSVGRVRIWNPLTREPIAAFTAHSIGLVNLAWAPDGRTLATSGDLFSMKGTNVSVENAVKLWNAEAGRELATLPKFGGPVFGLAFAPDGKTLAVGSWDPFAKTAELTMWNSQDCISPPLFKRRAPPILCLDFAPDGKTVATGGRDEAVSLWNAADGSAQGSFKGHSQPVRALAFSANGRTLASAGDDRTVRLWSVDKNPIHDVLTNAPGFSVAFSPDGNLLACGGSLSLQVWNVATLEPQFELALDAGDVLVAFSSDGKTLIATGTDGMLYFFDLSTRALRRKIKALYDKVWCLAISPDGRTLATGGGDRNVKLWDATTGEPRATFSGHTDRVTGLVFTPDGQTLISGGRESKEIKFWEVATGKLQRTWPRTGYLLAISRDGRVLAARETSQIVKLLDTTTGQELGRIHAHTSGISGMAFSRDGRTFVTTAKDGTTRLWHVPGAELLLTIPSELGVNWSTAFSPDGQTLAIAGGSAHADQVVLLRAATETEASQPEQTVPAVAMPKGGPRQVRKE